MLRLDGFTLARRLRSELKAKIEAQRAAGERAPGLAVVLVGDDPASQVYVRNKERACEEVGIHSAVHRLPATASFAEIERLIQQLNGDSAVDGILAQLPLPKGIDSSRVISLIDPAKDADGLTRENLGRLWMGEPLVLPCTPAGIMALLHEYHIPLAGRHAVVVGRSAIVGRPLSHLLSMADATVTICHSKTVKLAHYTRQADLVVVAAGRPRLLGREDFKEGAAVVDVGIHRLTTDGESRLCGDVRHDELESWVQACTPVPGGVGPMTIAMLLENTYKLYSAKLI